MLIEPSAPWRIAGSGASHTCGCTGSHVLEGKLLVLSQGGGSVTGALLRSMLRSTNWSQRAPTEAIHQPAGSHPATALHCSESNTPSLLSQQTLST